MYNCKTCGHPINAPPHLDVLCPVCNKKQIEIPSRVEDMEPCQHLEDNICGLASWMLDGQPIPTTPESCKACQRCSKPMDVNEITLSLAGIKESEHGPGTTLQTVISWFVAQPKNCGCPDRVALMNAWGKKRCRKEIPTILAWLRESALDNNMPYSEYVISCTLKLILR